MSAGNFRPADLEQHARFGIPPELLAAVARRVTDNEARESLGVTKHAGDLAGVLYARLDPETGGARGYRLRRDHPEMEDGKPRDKYLSSIDRPALFFAPGARLLLRDTTITVVTVEAEKSALALTAAGARIGRPILAIATGGVWGWKGRIGKTTAADGSRVDEKGVLPDFDRVVWGDRDVVILFDSNAATNEKVQAARRALGKELTGRGARVRIAELPVEPNVNGPDDYCAQHGDAALFALVDAAKVAGRPKKEKTEKPKQGREVQLDDPEPWPDPVDGAALLDELATMFERYLALPAHASTAIALWVLHAYAFSAWFTSPFLAVTSPAKRCGKTLLLIVLGALVPRRLFASNVTPAVLFRTIEKYSPTLLIDEADSFIRDNDELRGVLNSGHTKTTAVTIRAVGDDHEPRAFSTWCPKAIALIGKLPGTLADRAIEIRMRRRTAGEHVERLRQDRIEVLCHDLRRQAARWAVDHMHALGDTDPLVPDALNDRAADCWRPLMAVGEAVAGKWPARAREAALALSGEADDDDAATLLLHDIRGIFADDDDPEVLASGAIVERLVGLEDRPWAEWSKGRPLSPAKLARLLAGYGVHPAGSIRVGAKTARAYRRAAFVEAWERYLGDVKASQRDNPNEYAAESPISKRDTERGCHALQSVTNPIDTARCHGVTVLEGEEVDL